MIVRSRLQVVRLVLAAALLLGATAAQAQLTKEIPPDKMPPPHPLTGVVINITRQRMTVIPPDGRVQVWPVATGREGLETPPGRYVIIWKDKDHKSSEYDDAPMPFAMFFTKGYAIHATFEPGLGRPASHGCVRLALDKARLLFDMLQEGDEIQIIQPPKDAPKSARDTDALSFAGGAPRGVGENVGYAKPRAPYMRPPVQVSPYR